MRNKLILPTLSVAIVVVLAALAVAVSLSTPGSAQNNYEERLDNLETRVAVLEEEVGIDDNASESNQTSQQTNVSSSSSQTTVSSSSNQSVGAYSASFTSSGDKEYEVEISTPGAYTLTATAGSSFKVELRAEDGEPVPAFTLESDEGGTLTATADLEPGFYVLGVEASSMWSVTITSFSE